MVKVDPTLKNKVLKTLKHDFAAFSGNLKIVAKYILENPADFGLDPIRETARKSKVSTYSLVRMSKQLGFESFDALREPFRVALVAEAHSSTASEWIDALARSGTMGKVQARASQNTISIVNRSLHHMKPDATQDVVDIMFKAKTLYVMGVRSSFGIAHYFHYVGRMALPSMTLIPRHMNSAIDDMTTSDHRDVLIAITFTPYSNETIQACKFAKSRGMKLVLITDSEAIAAELEADKALVVSTATTHYFASYTGAWAVVETLLALLVKRGGKPAQKRIESYDTLRLEFDAYWQK